MPVAGAVTILRLIILLRANMRCSLRNRREHYRALSHRRRRNWPLPVMHRKSCCSTGLQGTVNATILPATLCARGKEKPRRGDSGALESLGR